MTQSDAEITIRPYRPGDEGAINEGFNEVFGLDRSLDEWRWKFPEQPEGRFIMLALDPSGRVVAHYGAVAMQVQFGSERACGGEIVDAYSREEVRGLRVFSTCYERFIEAFGNAHALPLMFGFPGRRHYEMGFKVLKYVSISPVPYWSRAARRRLWPTGWLYEVREGFDAAAVDDLWSRAAARYDVAIVRDAGWLGRRYRGRPGVDYVHLSAWRRGQVHAWAVARPQEGTLRWSELVWDGRDASALSALDRALAGLARRHACARLELWLGGDPAAELALAGLGWARATCPQDLLLVARTFQPVVDLHRMQERHYLTMGDSDLV